MWSKCSSKYYMESPLLSKPNRKKKEKKKKKMPKGNLIFQKLNDGGKFCNKILMENKSSTM